MGANFGFAALVPPNDRGLNEGDGHAVPKYCLIPERFTAIPRCRSAPIPLRPAPGPAALVWKRTTGRSFLKLDRANSARRAQAVRDYLASRGISTQRMRTISYGKERPVAVCNDISCWSQNRRAVTVLNASS